MFLESFEVEHGTRDGERIGKLTFSTRDMETANTIVEICRKKPGEKFCIMPRAYGRTALKNQWLKENPWLTLSKREEPKQLEVKIEKVIFNNPATIVIWSDGVKTVVKRQKGDRWDKEKGLAMAIAKRAMGNKGNYCNELSKWLSNKEEK